MRSDGGATFAQNAPGRGVSAGQLYASLQKAGRLDSIEREITEKKVFEFLKAQSEIT